VATWERRERTVHVTEYVVPADEPWGACWNQLQQAINAAIADLRPFRLPIDEHWEPADDAIRVHVGDGEIVLRIEEEAPHD
jgi:hypothetical protein